MIYQLKGGFISFQTVLRHVMPSTDRRLELKAKDIEGSDRLTAGCVLIDLASSAVSRTAVYANGLKMQRDIRLVIIHSWVATLDPLKWLELLLYFVSCLLKLVYMVLS